MSYLEKNRKFDEASLRKAIIYGSALGSFAVEEFGFDKLEKLDLEQVEERVYAFKALTEFDLD